MPGGVGRGPVPPLPCLQRLHFKSCTLFLALLLRPLCHLLPHPLSLEGHGHPWEDPRSCTFPLGCVLWLGWWPGPPSLLPACVACPSASALHLQNGRAFVVKACLPLPLVWVRVPPRSECWAKQDPKAEAMASAIKCWEQIREKKAARDLPGLGVLALLGPHCGDSPGGLQEAGGARDSLAHPLSLCRCSDMCPGASQTGKLHPRVTKRLSSSAAERA